jgi:hypothetical protein
VSTASVWEALCALDGVVESESALGDGPAIWVNGKEIAHMDGPDVVDLRLTRAVISELRPLFNDDDRVIRRSKGSDWVEVRVNTAADLEFAATLAERAIAAHRAPPGTTTKPPPTGAALARRKKFH